MKSYKNRFPFPIGAPSYVIPVKDDSVAANARFLSGLFDMVQLLFFGRDHLDEVMSPRIIRDLKKIGDGSGLRYTVHLPADLALLDTTEASLRGSIDVIERVLNATGCLGVEGYVLHVDGGPARVECNRSARDAFGDALGAMAARLGDAAADIYLENISYDLTYFGDIINGGPFPVCMDAGHLLFHGHDQKKFIDTFGTRIRQVHLHGSGRGKDHSVISESDMENVKAVAELLRKMPKPLIIEVYNKDDLEKSVQSLAGFFCD